MLPKKTEYISIPFDWLEGESLPEHIHSIYEDEYMEHEYEDDFDVGWFTYYIMTGNLCYTSAITSNYHIEHLCNTPDEFVQLVNYYETQKLLGIKH
ncbi:hypothetical protein ACFBZI_10690 [Moraxella sp. ZJ142]|uniref:hypothetical protein n=1 Tax=Moraxella marmotae TaxID=3344520 RepID=UPI0035D401C7